MKLEFLDKRDKEGRMLQYEAYEFNFYLTKNIIKIFKKKSIFSELIKIFPEKNIQFYFEKYFFETFIQISNQYTIYKHDVKNQKKNIISGSVLGTFARTLPKNNKNNVFLGSLRGTFARTLRNKIQNTLFPELPEEALPGHFQKFIIITL